MVEIAITSDASRDAGKKVLVVDDNRDAARMLQVLLKMQGCEVSIAHDGIEALAAAKASRPDVILMDLTLPRMSGVEVAEELRKSDSFRRPLSWPSPAMERIGCRNRRRSTAILQSP